MIEMPSVVENEADCGVVEAEECWYEPIRNYLLTGECSDKDSRTIEAKSSRYTMIGKDLYRRGYSRPLLKCVTKTQAKYILEELHQGVCGFHSGARTTLARTLRAGYYWPTMQTDRAEYCKKCEKCQEFGNIVHSKPETLHGVTSP